jgi:hypothetical protein
LTVSPISFLFLEGLPDPDALPGGPWALTVCQSDKMLLAYFSLPNLTRRPAFRATLRESALLAIVGLLGADDFFE